MLSVSSIDNMDVGEIRKGVKKSGFSRPLARLPEAVVVNLPDTEDNASTSSLVTGLQSEQ